MSLSLSFPSSSSSSSSTNLIFSFGASIFEFFSFSSPEISLILKINNEIFKYIYTI